MDVGAGPKNGEKNADIADLNLGQPQGLPLHKNCDIATLSVAYCLLIIDN